MTRFASAAFAVALVAVLTAGALVLTRSTGPQTGGPSPTTGASPGPTTAPSTVVANPLPAGLQGVWLSANRTFRGSSSVAGTAMHIGPDSIAMTPVNEGNLRLLAVDASSSGSTLTISTASGPSDECQSGQTGRYTYVLSASGQTLTIGGDDTCPQRASLFGGIWWLSDCHTQDQEPCLGVLDAGDYGSEYFASIGAHRVPWEAHFGALRFTVPSGWANDADWPSAFSLTPSSDFAAEPLHGSPAKEIAVYSNVIPESQSTPCSGQPEAGGVLDAAAYVAWLRTVPGLDVGATSKTSIGLRQALVVEVTVPTAPTAVCDGRDAVVEYLLSAGWYASNASASTGTQTHAIGAGNHDRLILLDMPSGYLTAIVITTDDGSAFDGFAHEAMPIVSSFRFTDAFPTP